MIEVVDVVDADATKPLGADRIRDPLGTTVDTAAGFLDRDEQQVAVDGRIALAPGTHDTRAEGRARRIRKIPNLQSAEVALKDDLPHEREIRIDQMEIAVVRRVEKAVRPIVVAHQHEVARRFTRILPPCLEPDPRIRRLGRAIALRAHDGGRGHQSNRETQGPRQCARPSSAHAPLR